jgi:hypothetical protein
MTKSIALLLGWLPLFGLSASAAVPENPEPSPPTTVQQWEKLAIEEFPELRISQSDFNRLFLEQVDVFREHWPETFQDPAWPYRIALWTSQWLAQKKADAEAHRLRIVLAAPTQGEKSRVLSEICKRVVREKLKTQEIKGHEGEWIHGDHLEKSRMISALYLALQNSPEVMTALINFVEAVLRQPGQSLAEDCKWLEAILQTPLEKRGTANTNPPLHSNIAAQLGLEDPDFVFALLGEIGDVNFAEDYLYGRVLTRLDTAAPSQKLRTQLIQKLLREGLKLGSWTLSKESCAEFLFIGIENWGIALQGDMNFELLENFEPTDWPESFARHTRAPNHPFNKADKEWQDYLQVLEGVWINLMEGKWGWSGMTIPPKIAAPGRLEWILLRRCMRQHDPKAAQDFLRDVRQHLLKSSTQPLRNRAEIVSAIEYVLAERPGPLAR